MEPARDVIDKDGVTFEFHATRLVAAVITQNFSYMVDSGVQYGYICTGEAFIFLHIPEDPTSVYYYLCVPNQDVKADDDCRLHRTSVGQVLAFTLHALAAELPTQEWHDAAQEKLSTWKVEYLDVLRDIPESIRKEPPSSEYKSLSWKPVNRSPYNTRSRARCQPDRTTPEETSGEGSESDRDLRSPSPAVAARSRQGHGSNRRAGQSNRTEKGNTANSSHSKTGKNTRQYCTMKCIRGLVTRSRLDRECPNVHEHGSERHSLSPRELIRRLHAQLTRDRNAGFEQLHLCGRTGFLLKTTLLSHGYTVVIKATTVRKEHNLRAEIATYNRLRPLQGSQIPVCVGEFKPCVSYWYHGQLMTHMMILSWSGVRIQNIINRDNASLFQVERDKLVKVLRSYGVAHGDMEWRNILWDDSAGCAVMIDFEEVTWLRRPPLGSASVNIARRDFSHNQNCLHDKHAPPPASALQV